MGCEIVPIKSSNEIERRVRELGIQIAHDYSGRDLVLIGILKGAFIFLGDLARAITMPLTIDFIRVESYKNTSSTGTVRIITDLTQPIEGKHVLVVDDIVDTGITMDFLLRNLKTRRPASLRVCSFLFKPARNIVPVKIDYLGFEIPNVYVVGYGMDCDGKFRNHPFLGILTEGRVSGTA